MVVDGKPVENYIKDFKWDPTKHQYRGQKLVNIVANIQSNVNRTDDELKKFVVEYTEKTMALAALTRRRTVNFSTSDLEDFLTPEKLASIEPNNSESILMTVLVVVNKSTQKGNKLK